MYIHVKSVCITVSTKLKMSIFSLMSICFCMSHTCLRWGNYFKTFCEKMLARCPGLHLWAASCLQGTVPTGWQVEHLTRPLRCPPAVVQEIEQANQMTSQPHRPPLVRAYTSRGVPDHTEGPAVKRVCHEGLLHTGGDPRNCSQCGDEVASFLSYLRVGEKGKH